MTQQYLTVKNLPVSERPYANVNSMGTGIIGCRIACGGSQKRLKEYTIR